MANQRHLVDAYEPIEDILARPKVRILRALRWFGWVTAADLWLAIDLDDADPDRDSLRATLSYLARTGRVEHNEREYRITDIGRADLAKTLRDYERRLDVAKARIPNYVFTCAACGASAERYVQPGRTLPKFCSCACAAQRRAA